MKSTKFLAVLPILTLLVAMGTYAPNQASAKSYSLAAPTGLGCDIGMSDLTADWDNLTGASKYSVEVTATYDLAPTQKFSFSTTSSDFTTSLDSLDSTDIVYSGDPATGASIAVKGLNPSSKIHSQNNPFAFSTCDPYIPE